MTDNRIPLDHEKYKDKNIILGKGRESGFLYTSLELFARGGGSLVYKSKCSNGMDVLIKEAYHIADDGRCKARNEKGELSLDAETASAKYVSIFQEKDVLRNTSESEEKMYLSNLTGYVDYIESFSENNTFYSVMSYKACYKTLTEYIKTTKMDLESVLWAIKSILDNLEKLHGFGRLHLDTKPDNLIVTDMGESNPFPTVLLIDFNSMHRVNDSGELINTDKKDFVLSFSGNYAAPEVKERRTKEVSFCSDTYSVMKVLEWMLNEVDRTAENNWIYEKIKHLLQRCFSEHRHDKTECFRNVKDLLKEIQGIVDDIRNTSFEAWLDEKHSATVFSDNELHYTSDKYEYIERTEDKDILKFLQDDGSVFGENKVDFAWWSIAGKAGSGKSRFVYNLTKNLPATWRSLFVTPDMCNELAYVQNEDKKDKYIKDWSYIGNLLLIFDYAERMAESIGKFIEHAINQSSLGGGKLRLLFIERNGLQSRKSGQSYSLLPIYGGSYIEWYQSIVAQLGIGGHNKLWNFCFKKEMPSLELSPITLSDYENAIDRKGLAQKKKTEILDIFEKIDPEFHRPIFFIMLLYMIKSDFSYDLSAFSNAEDLVEAIVEKEKDLQCEKAGVSDIQEGTILSEWCRTTATFGVWSSTNYDILPLEPDLLGEYLVIHSLAFSICDPNAFIAQCFTDCPKSFSQFLTQCVDDFQDVGFDAGKSNFPQRKKEVKAFLEDCETESKSFLETSWKKNPKGCLIGKVLGFITENITQTSNIRHMCFDFMVSIIPNLKKTELSCGICSLLIELAKSESNDRINYEQLSIIGVFKSRINSYISEHYMKLFKSLSMEIESGMKREIKNYYMGMSAVAFDANSYEIRADFLRNFNKTYSSKNKIVKKSKSKYIAVFKQYIQEMLSEILDEPLDDLSDYFDFEENSLLYWRDVFESFGLYKFYLDYGDSPFLYQKTNLRYKDKQFIILSLFSAAYLGFLFSPFLSSIKNFTIKGIALGVYMLGGIVFALKNRLELAHSFSVMGRTSQSIHAALNPKFRHLAKKHVLINLLYIDSFDYNCYPNKHDCNLLMCFLTDYDGVIYPPKSLAVTVFQQIEKYIENEKYWSDIRRMLKKTTLFYHSEPLQDILNADSTDTDDSNSIKAAFCACFATALTNITNISLSQYDKQSEFLCIPLNVIEQTILQDEETAAVIASHFCDTLYNRQLEFMGNQCGFAVNCRCFEAICKTLDLFDSLWIELVFCLSQSLSITLTEDDGTLIHSHPEDIIASIKLIRGIVHEHPDFQTDSSSSFMEAYYEILFAIKRYIAESDGDIDFGFDVQAEIERVEHEYHKQVRLYDPQSLEPETPPFD